MKIVLIRHGSRDHTADSDNGLNHQGQKQAASLFAHLEPLGTLPKPSALFSSPKKRARETLLPVSEQVKIPLQTEPLLDEQRENENSVEFRSRVRKFLDQLAEKYKPNDAVYLCTHADWLFEAMIVMPTDAFEYLAETVFACGETRIFEYQEGLWVYKK